MKPLPDVLLLVLLRHQNVIPVWFQVVGRDFAQDLHVDSEVHFQTALLYVVVSTSTNGCTVMSTSYFLSEYDLRLVVEK